MKNAIIPYIAIGLLSSIGIKYSCIGQEMFPKYYGSPFVFKQKSLGSSLEYFYSIFGLILNITIWSILLILIRLIILKLIKNTKENKAFKAIYKTVVVVLIVFSTLNIAIESIMIASGFEEGRNYWYMDLDKEAKKWKMECNGEWTLFNK